MWEFDEVNIYEKGLVAGSGWVGWSFAEVVGGGAAKAFLPFLSERSEKGYRFSGSGLKRGMKNNIFLSEIGSGF